MGNCREDWAYYWENCYLLGDLRCIQSTLVLLYYVKTVEQLFIFKAAV